MYLFKLQSSDGMIFTIDAATVKQMMTIQTMIDQEEEDSDEVTPIPTVKAQTLDRLILWIEYHTIDHENAEKIAWVIQYFNIDLKNIYEVIIAADYLEVKSLLRESLRNILINSKWKIIKDPSSGFHNQKVVNIMERELGNEVIVTIVHNKYLKYFDTRVIETQKKLSFDYLKYFRQRPGHILQIFPVNMPEMIIKFVVSMVMFIWWEEEVIITIEE